MVALLLLSLFLGDPSAPSSFPTGAEQPSRLSRWKNPLAAVHELLHRDPSASETRWTAFKGNLKSGSSQGTASPTAQPTGDAATMRSPAAQQPVAAPPTSSRPPAGFIPLPNRQRPTPIHELAEQDLLDALRQSTWVQNPKYGRGATADLASNPREMVCPWHHPSITALIDRYHGNDAIELKADPTLASRLGPQLRSMLARREGEPPAFQAVAAALVLAGFGDEAGLEVLSGTLLDERSHFPCRVASMYALAQFPHHLDRTSLDQLFDEWYPDPFSRDALAKGNSGARRFTDSERLEMATALLWGIARIQITMRSSDPSQPRETLDERFARAVLSEYPSLRRVVAIGYSIQKWERIPDDFARLISDPDPSVRASAIASLAAQPTAAGEECVLAATRDREPNVRLLAIQQLAEFPTPAVRTRIDQLVRADRPAERAAAVKSAAKLGWTACVMPALNDDQVVVRTAAAGSLTNPHEPGVQMAVRDLFKDRSLQVQLAAIESLTHWPADLAIPIYLDALDSSAVVVRRRTTQALAPIWPEAVRFPADASPEQRTVFLQKMRDAWQADHSRWASKSAPNDNDRAGQPTSNRSVPPAAQQATPIPRSNNAVPTVDEAQRTAARVMLQQWQSSRGGDRRELRDAMLSLGNESLATYEQLLVEQGQMPDSALVRDVFASMDPTYRQIADLVEGEPRLAASRAHQLAGQMKYSNVSSLQALMLRDYTKKSDSDAAWMHLMPLLERDHPELIDSLDDEGLRHQSTQVRISTLERLSARPDAQISRSTMESLFRDPAEEVRLAALKTAGTLHDPAMANAVRTAMEHPSPRVRLEAAAALMELGDAEGVREVVRLTREPDLQIRRQALLVVANSERIGNAQALPILEGALSDRKIEIQRVAVAGLERRTNKSFTVDSVGTPIPLGDQLLRWRRYLAERPMQAN